MITDTEQARYILTSLDQETLNYLIDNVDTVNKVLNDLRDESIFIDKIGE